MLKEKSINLTIICWPQNVNLTQTTVWYCFVGIWLDYNYTVLSFFLSLPPPGGTLTNEEVPNSLYQPITMLERSRSSSMIWATPMNTFLPSTLQHTSLSTKVVLWRHQSFKIDQEVQVAEVLYFFSPSVISPHSDLQDASSVSFMKEKLLLEQWVQGSPGRRGLSLGQALLTTDQVDLDPGSW